MKKHTAGILFIMLTLLLSGNPHEERTLHYELRTRMPDKTLRMIRKNIISLGGVIHSATLQKMIFRVPDAKAAATVEAITSKGTVRDMRDEKENTEEKMLILQTKIDKKKEHLKKVQETYDDANISEIVSIIQITNDIIMEIEELEENLRYLSYRSNTTEITLLINQYGAISNKEHKSRWNWVNDLGVENLFYRRFR